MPSFVLKRGGKPVFGPPVSPEIFEAKWHHRLTERTLNVPASMQESPKTESEIIAGLEASVKFNRKVLEILHYAQLEAKSIGLSEQSHGSQSRKVDNVTIWERFEVARSITHFCVVQYGDAKNGKPFFGRLPWQSTPLALRKEMRDLIATVEALQEREDWKLDLDIFEGVMGGLGYSQEVITVMKGKMGAPSP